MSYLKTITLLCLLFTFVGCEDDEPTQPGDAVCFTRDVQPVINAGCAKSGCHDSTTNAGSITLITYSEIASTDDLVEVLTKHESDGRMPPLPWKKLSEQQIELIAHWVEQGSNNTMCDSLPPPDTSNVSYTTDISPIMDLHCIGCHATQGAGTGPRLLTEADVLAEALYGNLIPSIEHRSSYVWMPPGRTSVSWREIEMIKAWSSP